MDTTNNTMYWFNLGHDFDDEMTEQYPFSGDSTPNRYTVLEYCDTVS